MKSAQNKLSDLKTLTKQFKLSRMTGVWRCSERLVNIEIPYAATLCKYPVLLPKSHPLITLIMKQANECVLHNRVKETIAETRTGYWVEGALLGTSEWSVEDLKDSLSSLHNHYYSQSAEWRRLQPSPRRFISDNGKAFKAALQYLDTILRMDQYKNATQDLQLPGNSMWSKPCGGEVHSKGWCKIAQRNWLEGLTSLSMNSLWHWQRSKLWSTLGHYPMFLEKI